MSSSWPPELKTWVQECLSKATPSNKTAVNAELKQVLFKAHADGTLNTTDWANVELQALKAQSHRTTHVAPIAANPYSAHLPPPGAVTSSFTPYRAPYPTSVYSPPTAISSSTGKGATNGLSLGGHSIQASASPSVDTKKKKRKKDDMAVPSQFVSAEESDALARRAARFQQSGSAQNNGTIGGSSYFDPNDSGMSGGVAVGGKKRLRGKAGLGYGGVETPEVDPNVLDWDHLTIKGTSSKLEKSYLRLTSEPSPADIRPLPVLRQTLNLLKLKWKELHNYAYAVDQFKSMRQDLTVQRIKNEFTVEVYEIHARIALEAKDLGEYNQCQSMLRQLYELGIKGHPQEFLSYRIIYLLHTKNRSDMASLMAQLTPAEKADPSIHHALQVHAALATSNYARFFRLFATAPNMSGYIMDHFVERERMSALAVMSKAYNNLALPYITRILAFDSENEADTFLASHNAAIYTNPFLPQPSSAKPVRLPAWKPAPPPPPTPLADLVWDAKKAAGSIVSGLEKYRIVDLKGQIV